MNKHIEAIEGRIQSGGDWSPQVRGSVADQDRADIDELLAPVGSHVAKMATEADDSVSMTTTDELTNLSLEQTSLEEAIFLKTRKIAHLRQKIKAIERRADTQMNFLKDQLAEVGRRSDKEVGQLGAAIDLIEAEIDADMTKLESLDGQVRCLGPTGVLTRSGSGSTESFLGKLVGAQIGGDQ